MIDRVAQRLQTFLVCGAILPFVLISLIGTAVMPVRGADGTLMMVICTGVGTVEIALDPVTMEPVSDEGRKNNTAPEQRVCDWVAAQSAFILTAPVVLAAALQRVAQARASFGQTTLIVAQATGLPPSTGPPHLL